MKNFIPKRYQEVPSFIRRITLGEFFIQMIQANFLLIFLNFMNTYGYSDYEGANVRKYLFLSSLIVAIPLGIYLKGKKLRPFMITGAILAPISALALIYSIKYDWIELAKIFGLILGLSSAMRKIPMLPYIMQNTNESNRTSSIALSFITWSAASIVVGLLNKFLTSYFVLFQDEFNLLLLSTLISLPGIYFYISSKKEETPYVKQSKVFEQLKEYDWNKILFAMTPSFLIALGAGITIPNMSIFFLKVHDMDSGTFSLLGAITSVLVVIFGLLVPYIKQRFGYSKSVILTQTIAITALFLVGVSEFYSTLPYMALFAGLFYLIRQPFMNMAHPITSEMSIQYVGQKNQELISALDAAIWGGSWYISSFLFEIMRENKIPYAHIFFITCFLYIIGSIFFYLLSKKYHLQSTQKN